MQAPPARRARPPRAGAGARPAQAPGARRASKREAARRGGEANSPGAARSRMAIFAISDSVANSPGAARPAVPVPFRRFPSRKPPGTRRARPPRAGAGARPAQAPGARRASKREAARRGGEANSLGGAMRSRMAIFAISDSVASFPGRGAPCRSRPFPAITFMQAPGAARPPTSRWRRSVRRKFPRHGRSIVRHDHQAPGPPQTAAFSTGAPDKRPAAPLTAFHRGFGACLQRSRKYS